MAGEYLRRTAVTRLRLTEQQQELLDATIADWKTACNIASRIGWRAGQTRKSQLQSLCYDEIRDETRLGSQHAILAVQQAASALSGIDEIENLDEKYEVSRPVFTSETITYDSRSMTVFEDETVSLATVEDRIRCDLVLPECNDGYQYEYLDAEGWTLTESTLTTRDGEYYLHLGFRRSKSEPKVATMADGEDRTVLGVDLGIVNIATTSTAYFASGRELRHRHREFERIRGSLQQTGTQSAHRTIQQLQGRESRHTRDVLHQVSKNILDEARAHDCEYIVFENLIHIGQRAPPVKAFHEWAHRQLVNMVEYKAEAVGINVVYVSPEYTSQRCPKCSHTSESNRVSQTDFECEECGASGNADYIAAKNIGWKCVRRGQQSSRRMGDRQLALKSGTVSPTEGFNPTDPPSR